MIVIVIVIVIITHNNNPSLTLVSKDYTFKVLADGANPNLFATDQTQFPNSNNKSTKKYIDVSQQHPKLTDKYKRLTLGIYETSKYMLYHNKSLDN